MRGFCHPFLQPWSMSCLLKWWTEAMSQNKFFLPKVASVRYLSHIWENLSNAYIQRRHMLRVGRAFGLRCRVVSATHLSIYPCTKLLTAKTWVPISLLHLEQQCSVNIHCSDKKNTYVRGWRDSSAFKSVYFSLRGSENNSERPHHRLWTCYPPASAVQFLGF